MGDFSKHISMDKDSRTDIDNRTDTAQISRTDTVRVGVYARVSTSDQTCESQLRELREYVARRAWQVSGEYVDTGWSGSKASRPQLDRLMTDASHRRFDCICVYKIDRFGRSVLHLNQQLATLTSYGVRFIAVSQGLDTDQSSPTARLLLHILASVAEFERELIRERVRAGIKSARHKGTQLGRKRIIFDRSKVVEMHEAGASIREIAAALDIGRGTIQRFLLTQKPIRTDVLHIAERPDPALAETVGT
jgi:putative DNA-invertase from lambdoid prophage Rac